MWIILLISVFLSVCVRLSHVIVCLYAFVSGREGSRAGQKAEGEREGDWESGRENWKEKEGGEEEQAERRAESSEGERE